MADAQRVPAPPPAPDTMLAAAVLAGPATRREDGTFELEPFLVILGQLEAVIAA